jgi:hypothetical protein
MWAFFLNGQPDSLVQWLQDNGFGQYADAVAAANLLHRSIVVRSSPVLELPEAFKRMQRVLLTLSVGISLRDVVDPVRLPAEMHARRALTSRQRGFTLNPWTPPGSFPAG